MKQFKKDAGTSPLQAPREDRYTCAADRMPQSEENQPWGSTGLQIPAVTLECEAAEPSLLGQMTREPCQHTGFSGKAGTTAGSWGPGAASPP